MLAEAGVEYQEHHVGKGTPPAGGRPTDLAALAATGFAVGRELTVADLALWYLLKTIQDNGFGAALDGCPALRAFFGRLAARPRLAAYLSSPGRPPFTPLPR